MILRPFKRKLQRSKFPWYSKILSLKVVQIVHSVVQMLKCYAGEQYFLVNVVLFFMLYKVAVASTKMSKLNPTVTI